MSKYSASAVLVKFAAVTVADQKLYTAIESADNAFTDSATFLCDTLASGVSALSVEHCVKAKFAKDGIRDRNFYSANSMIGVHATTGMALKLPGTLPLVTTAVGSFQAGPRDLQAIVKVVGQKQSKAIIAAAGDQEEAFNALLKAKQVKEAAKAKTAKDETDETDETDESDKAETSIESMLISIESILSGATKRQDWTSADKAKAKALGAILAKASMPIQFSSK